MLSLGSRDCDHLVFLDLYGHSLRIGSWGHGATWLGHTQTMFVVEGGSNPGVDSGFSPFSYLCSTWSHCMVSLLHELKVKHHQYAAILSYVSTIQSLWGMLVKQNVWKLLWSYGKNQLRFNPSEMKWLLLQNLLNSRNAQSLVLLRCASPRKSTFAGSFPGFLSRLNKYGEIMARMSFAQLLKCCLEY